MNTNEIINVEALPAEVRKHTEARINEIFQPASDRNALDPIAQTTPDGFAVTLTAKNAVSKVTYEMNLIYWQLNGQWGCTETTYEVTTKVATHGLI